MRPPRPPSPSSSSGESSAGEANVLFYYSNGVPFPFYAGLQMRRWLPNVNHGLCSCTRSGLSECLQTRLTALCHLSITGCSNIKSLLVEAVPQLLSLKSLHLENCSDLSALPGEHLLCRLTLLEDLSITACPELSGLSTIPALAASLKILRIASCPKLAGLPGELLRQLGSLQTLSILNCDGLEQLGGLRALISLQVLRIKGCPRIRSLIDEDGEDNRLGLEGLTNLLSMTITGCGGLQSLPGGLEHLSSLQSLDIRRCPEVTSLGPLPSSLEKLVIHGCPALANSCRKCDGPDWHNIAHVPNIRVDRTILQGFNHLDIIGV